MAQTVPGSIVVIIVCITAALGFLFGIRRFWVPSARHAHNDAIGPNVSVIGTTYAVIVAFMLSGVWNDMRAAQLNTEQEANRVVNIYRFAEELPAESKVEIQKLARDYAQVMVNQEWPAMARDDSSPAGHAIMRNLWRAMASGRSAWQYAFGASPPLMPGRS